MKIVIKLSEVLDRCDNWENFCLEKGFTEMAVNEGAGDIEVTLTEQEAFECGLFNDYR